ncbi:MAG: AAA family ATPase [Nitrospirota bacterium]
MSFKIYKVHFYNIRNFKNTEVVLKNPLLLVGQNDHGKSSVLKILNSLFNEIDDDIIEGKKNIPDNLLDRLNPDREVGHEARRVILHIEIKDGRTRRKYLANSSSHIVPLLITLEASKKKLKFIVGKARRIKESDPRALALFKELRKKTKFLLIPAVRDVGSEAFVNVLRELIKRDALDIFPQGVGGTTKGYRLLKQVREGIKDELIPLVDDEVGKKITEELLMKCESNFNFSFGLNEDKILELVMPHLRPLAKREENIFGVPIDEIGNGIQSMMLFAVLRLLKSKHAKGVNEYYAIEEPELFLHPQAQRQIFEGLMNLSKEGKHILITTHSTILVDRAKFSNIAFVRDSQVFQPNIDDSRREEINTNLTNIHNSEIYFGDFIVFVEGESDKIVLEEVFRKVRKQTKTKSLYGITVVNVGGKTRFAPLIKLLKSYGEYGKPFKWLILIDKDAMRKTDGERAVIRAMKDLGINLPSEIQDKLFTEVDKNCSNEEDALGATNTVNEIIRPHYIHCLPADIEYALITEKTLKIAEQTFKEEGKNYPQEIRSKKKLEYLRKYFGSKGINCEKNNTAEGKKPYLHAKIIKMTPLEELSEPFKQIISCISKEICKDDEVKKIENIFIKETEPKTVVNC